MIKVSQVLTCINRGNHQPWYYSSPVETFPSEEIATTAIISRLLCLLKLSQRRLGLAKRSMSVVNGSACYSIALMPDGNMETVMKDPGQTAVVAA